MNLNELDFAALDFETTGVDPGTARPVAAALLVIAPDGSTIYERSGLIDPGVEIPAEAASVHGITTERARKGRPVAEAIREIVQQLAPGGAVHGRPLVICNVPYDWALLMTELSRHELQPPPEPAFVDPLLLDRVLDKYRKGSRKLADMAKHYAVEFEGRAHGARADALAAVGVARRIMARFPEFFRSHTPETLRAEQANRYAEWRAGINAYWKARGEAKEVTNGWPF